MIATWNESLQLDEVNFDLTQMSRMWHLVENNIGSRSWATIEQMSLLRYGNDPVRATWMTNTVRWLVQVILGYQHTFGPAVPMPIAIPPLAPEGLTPVQIAEANAAREAARLHNTGVDNDQITVATAIGNTIGKIA